MRDGPVDPRELRGHGKWGRISKSNFDSISAWQSDNGIVSCRKEYNGEARQAFDQVFSQVQVEVEGDAAGDPTRIVDYEDMTPKQKKTYAKGR